jgi:hypothetical protein
MVRDLDRRDARGDKSDVRSRERGKGETYVDEEG